MNDPRLSAAQQATIQRASKSDDDAEILGLDGSYFPVVRVMAGIPREPRIFAVKTNGTPTEPEWEDPEALHDENNLYEPWINTRRR